MRMRSDESITFNPGTARHVIRIMKPVKTKNDFNEDVIAAHVHATVRAQVVALQGRELDAIQQRFADARYRIRMQYTPGIEREHWLEWNTEQGLLTLNIFDVQDPAGMSNFTQIYAGDLNAR